MTKNNTTASSLKKYASLATESFTLPDICLRIREILDDHRSDSEDIARLIAVDPSLSGKILKLANSALFRFPSQIDSISKAVSVIGGEALYNLVVAETATTAFKAYDTPLINLEEHWQSSVYTGVIAKYLAKQMGVRGSDRFFVNGILLNLSELVVAKFNPGLYRNYTLLSEGAPWDRQQAIFGFDFAHLSGLIMEKWQLPLPLYYPVQHVNNTEKQYHEKDIALLACALRVTICQARPEASKDIDLFSPATNIMSAISPDSLENITAYANNEAKKISSLIY